MWVIFSAALSWVFRTIIVKFVVIGALFWLLTYLVPLAIGYITPFIGTENLTALFNAVPDGLFWFLLALRFDVAAGRWLDDVRHELKQPRGLAPRYVVAPGVPPASPRLPFRRQPSISQPAARASSASSSSAASLVALSCSSVMTRATPTSR